MLNVLSESSGNLLVVRATEKLTAKDYEESFIPNLEKLISQYGKVKVVMFLDEGFVGWEMGAMWDDAKFGIKHRNDFEKVAVVGGPKCVEWGTKIVSHLMHGELKTFAVDKLEDALEWIK